ncbi:unnamed protein product [Haemonchus placei]|uniref:Uncharacterized protein n=1 Tax=Haemonchus placei TaxID=6290 RepID=A0A0N4WES2_HAEPC|nr:unnamed protein product [Haemonchus placei]
MRVNCPLVVGVDVMLEAMAAFDTIYVTHSMSESTTPPLPEQNCSQNELQEAISMNPDDVQDKMAEPGPASDQIFSKLARRYFRAVTWLGASTRYTTIGSNPYMAGAEAAHREPHAAVSQAVKAALLGNAQALLKIAQYKQPKKLFLICSTNIRRYR